MSLLTLESIHKNYFERPVLDGVSLRLDKGDRLALIGTNGAGKTTLLKIIGGLEQADSGKVLLPSGIIPGYLSQHVEEICELDKTALHDQELTALEFELRQTELEIAHLSEHSGDGSNAVAPDPGQTRLLAHYSQLTARYESAGGYDFEHRMQEALDGLGLSRDVLGRPLLTLSGGERMRVALARLLLRSPDLLLLDEPTNHLDAQAMEWLEQYLAGFKGAVLLISHDRTFIDRTANCVAELTNGQLNLRSGNYSSFQQAEIQQQETLLREMKHLSRELDRQQGVVQTMLSHRNMSGYHAREKTAAKLSVRLEQIKSGMRTSGPSMHFNFMPGRLDGAPDKVLIEANELAVAFNNTTLFKDVHLTVRRGDKICLCGPNGCGKTTLLNLIMGKTDEFSGTVRLSRQAVFGHMGQHVSFADESLTVLSTVTSRFDISDRDARTLLARYGFKDIDVFKQISVLSGGERARIYLCCLLLEQPDVLFLDEPTNHLDIGSREILEHALMHYDGSFLCVSHDRYFIEKCADRVLGFSAGHLATYQSFEEYRRISRSRPVREPGNRIPVQAPDRAATGHTSSEKPTRDRQPDSKETLQSQSGQAGTPLNERENRAQSRRRTARQKQEKNQLETAIETMEQEKTALESGFGSDCSPELYEQYACLLADIEQCYEQLIDLSVDMD